MGKNIVLFITNAALAWLLLKLGLEWFILNCAFNLVLFVAYFVLCSLMSNVSKLDSRALSLSEVKVIVILTVIGNIVGCIVFALFS